MKPRHRDQRDHHYEDVAGERVHVFGAGGVVSVCERYCAGCDVWLAERGVLGALRFMADHGGHEVADPPTDG